MTEPRDERSTPGRAAEADDPVWLAARLAEAQDQLAATREILRCSPRSSTSEDDVFEAVVEQRPPAVPGAGRPDHLADGDGYRW